MMTIEQAKEVLTKMTDHAEKVARGAVGTEYADFTDGFYGAMLIALEMITDDAKYKQLSENFGIEADK